MIAIAVPATLLHIAPADHTRVFALLASWIAAISMIVPPLAGALSDRLRASGSPRRWVIFAGVIVDAAALVFLGRAGSVPMLILGLSIATIGANVALAAYQALLPEVVPRSAWGAASGARGVAMLLGTVGGFAIAGTTSPSFTFVATGVLMLAGATTLFGVSERERPEREHGRVRDWHDFAVVFAARAWIIFGLVLLNTFVLFFFHDVLGVRNASAGTAYVGTFALVGAIVSTLWLGRLSDRLPRKYLVALCGVPMVLAALGFGLVPAERAVVGFAILFGIGYGGVISTGWALAIDALPELGDVARDLGIWGIAQNLPGVLAPPFGYWLLARFGGGLLGYRALFVAAAASFAIGSLAVLATRSEGARKSPAASLPGR